jgi:hypothetical protein
MVVIMNNAGGGAFGDGLPGGIHKQSGGAFSSEGLSGGFEFGPPIPENHSSIGLYGFGMHDSAPAQRELNQNSYNANRSGLAPGEDMEQMCLGQMGLEMRLERMLLGDESEDGNGLHGGAMTNAVNVKMNPANMLLKDPKSDLLLVQV